MSLASMSSIDLVGTLLGLVFTLFIFSYLLGDNVLFRIALHIFVGVAAGYVAVMAWYNVIWPKLFIPLLDGSQPERLLMLIPLVLGALLLTKAAPRQAGFGSLTIAFLVGVGAATAIGGAVLGTIFPQVTASVNLFDLEAIRQGETNFWYQLVSASVILVGTLTTLIYFHFSARPQLSGPALRPSWIENLSWIGQVFIAITFGALFAGVYSAAIAALIERLSFVVNFILPSGMP